MKYTTAGRHRQTRRDCAGGLELGPPVSRPRRSDRWGEANLLVCGRTAVRQEGVEGRLLILHLLQ
jgi:hypothetical protein